LVNQLLTAFPWLEKKCSGDGETSFFVYCKIWAAFREKMHQSCSLGFKGFSGNIEGFKPEYFTRHVEEEGHKHAGGFVSTKIANLAVLGPIDVCANVITPETHAQLKA